MRGGVGAMWPGGSLLLGIYGCDGGVHLLLWLQWMPLGDGAAGVGQHVGPVFQPGPRGLASHQDLPDGVVLADLVIIQDCDYSLDFLWRWRERVQRVGLVCFTWGGNMSPASGFTPLPDLMEVIEERLTIPVTFYPINQRDARKGL